MKVLHVEAGRNLYGGARQVLYLLEGLCARGVANVLVCPRDSAIAQTALPYVVGLYTLPMGGDTDLALVARLRRVIAAERPDIVHLHSRRGADVLGGIAARLAGVKTVLSRRVDNPESPFTVRWKYRLYDRIITISQGIRQVLLKEGLPDAKVVCVPSAVDDAPYRHVCEHDWFRSEFGLREGERSIGVIAQLIERKGHRFLIDALPEILKSHPEVRLLIFGVGPRAADIRAQIARLGLAAQVRLAGFRDDLERILCCLDIVVHPALMEGLGVSLLQAAAAGVPIVGTRAGGIPEVVRDGVNGILVPPGDSSAIAAAVTRLLDNPEEAAHLGQGGRALVRDSFSVPAMVEGNLAVYKEVLGQGEREKRKEQRGSS